MAASAVRVAACHESSIPWSPDVARKWVNDGSLATLVGPVSTPPGPIGKICSSGSPPVEASHATTHSPVGRRAVTGGCWVAGSSSATLGEDIAVWSGATVDIVKRVLAPLRREGFNAGASGVLVTWSFMAVSGVRFVRAAKASCRFRRPSRT